ncbi:MAG: hypothetical protein ACI9BF_000257 [Candidatus Paceibacteria bacterium]|jgi:hypothetical protein
MFRSVVFFSIMNDLQHNKKDSILKSLAIIGFISIIILISWISIQFVKVAPETFSSLASLAEGLSQRQEAILGNNEVSPIVVTSNEVLVQVSEPVKLSWGTTNISGSYTFSYSCTEGVAVDFIEADKLKSITCDTNYNLGDTNSLSLQAYSEKDRYVDLDYDISFLGTNDTEPRARGSASITVINTDISDILVTTEEIEEKVVAEDTETETITETDETTIEPSPVTEAVTPTYKQEFIYTIPVSNPNGRTDLSTRYLNTGTIVGSNFLAGEVNQYESGAIQFEVMNYGSKTSDKWSFSMTLPNGSTYFSKVQEFLKPNERAVLTIGFPVTDVADHIFTVFVSEPTDEKILNNSFSQKVEF